MDKHNNYKDLTKCFYKSNKINFILSIVTMLLLGILNVCTAFLFKGLTDIAIGGTKQDLVKIILIALLFIVTYIVFTMLRRFFYTKFMAKALFTYKGEIFKKVLSKDINAFNKETTGRYTSILTNDVNSIEMNYLAGIILIIYNIFLMITSLISMIYLNQILTITILLSIVIPLAVSAYFSGKLSKCEVQVSDQNEEYVNVMNSIFAGFPVIKSFKAEKQTLSNYNNCDEKLEHMKRKKRETAILINLSSFSSSFLVTLAVCAVGVYLILIGKETIGTVMAFIQLLDYVVNPIQQLATDIPNKKAAGQLINKIADMVYENTSDQNDKKEYHNFHDKIVFRDVSFGYDEDKTILKNINLEIEAGKSYAIVGLSGSGKTTILNLLLGYFDGYNGSIRLDEHEIRDIKASSLYDIVTVIQQNVYIFDDTIRNNITMLKEFDDVLVDKAIKSAGLSSLIEEKGIDHLCGENGKNLSGGEKQRIAIARALLNRSSILLVDEATSALDTVTSKTIVNSILDLDEITRLVVTHKLNTEDLIRYDKIIVMKSGEIIEFGEYEKLYQNKGYFYSLVNVAEDLE